MYATLVRLLLIPTFMKVAGSQIQILPPLPMQRPFLEQRNGLLYEVCNRICKRPAVSWLIREG